MKLIISALVILSLAACKDKEACEEDGYGYFSLTNTQSARYDIYIQGRQEVVYAFAGETSTVMLQEGYYNVKVKHFQNKDSIEGSIKINRCETVKWTK